MSPYARGHAVLYFIPRTMLISILMGGGGGGGEGRGEEGGAREQPRIVTYNREDVRADPHCRCITGRLFRNTRKFSVWRAGASGGTFQWRS